MDIASKILERLGGQAQLGNEEIQEIFSQIQEFLRSCTKKELELPQDILMQRALSQALSVSSSRAVTLFASTLRQTSLQKTSDLFRALQRIAPGRDPGQLVDVNRIPCTGVKILPVTRQSLAPDILTPAKITE